MFRKLRGIFAELEFDQAYIAEKLHVSQQSISNRMRGKYPWTLDEMYAVMDLIQEPYERLHEYFPKGGGTTAKRKAS
jgi:DNA-binding XRE family transcriptional regulator